MPVCNFCGTVHDGHSPTCPKCGRKVETVADSPIYSFDTAAEEAAEKSRLFALLAFLGVIFMPLSLIFGYMAFKRLWLSGITEIGMLIVNGRIAGAVPAYTIRSDI